MNNVGMPQITDEEIKAFRAAGVTESDITLLTGDGPGMDPTQRAIFTEAFTRVGILTTACESKSASEGYTALEGVTSQKTLSDLGSELSKTIEINTQILLHDENYTLESLIKFLMNSMASIQFAVTELKTRNQSGFTLYRLVTWAENPEEMVKLREQIVSSIYKVVGALYQSESVVHNNSSILKSIDTIDIQDLFPLKRLIDDFYRLYKEFAKESDTMDIALTFVDWAKTGIDALIPLKTLVTAWSVTKEAFEKRRANLSAEAKAEIAIEKAEKAAEAAAIKADEKSIKYPQRVFNAEGADPSRVNFENLNNVLGIINFTFDHFSGATLDDDGPFRLAGDKTLVREALQLFAEGRLIELEDKLNETRYDKDINIHFPVMTRDTKLNFIKQLLRLDLFKGQLSKDNLPEFSKIVMKVKLLGAENRMKDIGAGASKLDPLALALGSGAGPDMKIPVTDFYSNLEGLDPNDPQFKSFIDQLDYSPDGGGFESLRAYYQGDTNESSKYFLEKSKTSRSGVEVKEFRRDSDRIARIYPVSSKSNPEARQLLINDHVTSFINNLKHAVQDSRDSRFGDL